MIRVAKLTLASMFAIGLALPALALAQQAPDATTTPPAAAMPDSGIKTATPDATPAKTSVKHHHVHAKHVTKVATPPAVKS